MDPSSASVYTDTWSPLTWVLLLSAFVAFVFALMVIFIVQVHRSIEQTAGLPRATDATPAAPVVEAQAADAHEVPASSEGHPAPPHAA